MSEDPGYGYRKRPPGGRPLSVRGGTSAPLSPSGARGNVPRAPGATHIPTDGVPRTTQPPRLLPRTLNRTGKGFTQLFSGVDIPSGGNTGPLVIGPFVQATGANVGAAPNDIPWGIPMYSPTLERLVTLSTNEEFGNVSLPGAQYSDDGVAWNVAAIPWTQPTPVARSWFAGAWLPFASVYVALGLEVDVTEFDIIVAAYTVDGITWTSASLTGVPPLVGGSQYSAEQFSKIAMSDAVAMYCSLNFTAAGATDCYSLTTANGLSWSAVKMNAVALDSGFKYPRGPAFDVATQTFHAVGITNAPASPIVYSSALGVTWSVAALAVGTDRINGILYHATDGLILYGDDGAISPQGVIYAGASLGALTRTLVPQLVFRGLQWLSADLGYFALAQINANDGTLWAQSVTVTVWPTPAAITQQDVSAVVYAIAQQIVLGGFGGSLGSTINPGGSLVRAAVTSG